MARKNTAEKKTTRSAVQAEQKTKDRVKKGNLNKADDNQNISDCDDAVSEVVHVKGKETKSGGKTKVSSAAKKREARKRKSTENIENGIDGKAETDKKLKVHETSKGSLKKATSTSKGETTSRTKSLKGEKDNNIKTSLNNKNDDSSNSNSLTFGGENLKKTNTDEQDICTNSKPKRKSEKVKTEQNQPCVKSNNYVDERRVERKGSENGCDQSDVMSVLMQMEGPAAAQKGLPSSGALANDDDMMSDSENDFEGSINDEENHKQAGPTATKQRKKKTTKTSQKQNVDMEETVSKHFINNNGAKGDRIKVESNDDDDEDNDFVMDSSFTGTKQRFDGATDSPISRLAAASKRHSRKRKSDDSGIDLSADGKNKKTTGTKGSSDRKSNKKHKIDESEIKVEDEIVKIEKNGQVDSSCTIKSEPDTKSTNKKQKSRTSKTACKVTIKSVKTEDKGERSEEITGVKKENNKSKRKAKSESKTESKSSKTKKAKTDNKNLKKEKAETNNETKKIADVKDTRESIPSHITNSSDVMSILMHMEGPSTSQGHVKVNDDGDDEMMLDSDSEEKMNTENDSDESEGEWEDVEDHNVNSPKKSQDPSKSVEITLDAPVIYKKRKKKEFDLHDYLKKQVNKYKRELALDTHKAHLLCLISRGFYLNFVCGKDVLQAQVMSVVMTTRELTNPIMKKHSQGHLMGVLKWINKEFHLTDTKSSGKENMEDRLVQCLQNRTYSDNTQFTLLCIMVLRYLGFLTRIVMSLQPVPYKQAQQSGPQKSRKSPKGKQAKVKPRDEKSTTQSKKDSSSKATTNKKKQTPKSKNKVTKGSEKTETDADSKSSEKDAEQNSSKRNKRRCSKNLSKGAYKEQDDGNIDDVDGELDDDNDDDFKAGDESDSDTSECDNSVKDVKESKKGKGKSKTPGKRKSSGKRTQSLDDSTLSSDSDFEEDSILVRTQSLKKQPSSTKNQRVLSSDSDGSPNIDRKHSPTGNDTWLEVYIQAENKWISVCSYTKEVAKPAVIRSHASSPLYYVVSIDNNNAIKDVTIRYASEWLTKTRKLRLEDDWWTETLEPFVSADKDRDAAEDKDMQAYLLQCPLPTSISQFKGHPLYILKRHLLKYEALYPNTIVPVGYIRGEPVYSRDCCHTLHSRENWLKEGRCVRLKEEPYKYVKSRKRWNDKDTEPKECELFGKWQTEIYMPPPAVDGVIPRNAHGNVEMFQPWMLPGGTVHLKGLPALNRIARKLNLDCAPAMVGWDHHCGYAHPVMDGWIVCEEHKDILLAAWDEEQEIIQEREKEKREKRVYGNWKKLIRGMIIKERLKQRYDQEETPIIAPTEQKIEPTTSDGEKATDVEQSWPQNRLTNSSSKLGIVEKL